MKEGKLWINGQWHEAAGGKRIEVENPATGEIVGSVAAASTEDTLKAVAAAKRALVPKPQALRHPSSATAKPMEAKACVSGL